MTDRLIDSPTCFLCCDATPPLYKVCACAVVVHETCFQNLLSVPAHESHCAVCRRPYGVQVETRLRWRMSHPRTSLLLLLVIIAGVVVVAGGGVAFAMLLHDTIRSLLAWVLMASLGATMTVVLALTVLVWGMHYLQSRRWCCIKREPVVIRRTLTLPRAIKTENQTAETPTDRL